MQIYSKIIGVDGMVYRTFFHSSVSYEANAHDRGKNRIKKVMIAFLKRTIRSLRVENAESGRLKIGIPKLYPQVGEKVVGYRFDTHD